MYTWDDMGNICENEDENEKYITYIRVKLIFLKSCCER